MLNALDLAGIPLHAVDRGDDDPIVLAGGHAAFNPEPIADFVDAAVLGDGEEVVLAISEVVREWKAEGRPGGPRRAAAAARRDRRRLRAASSTTSTYAADGAIEARRAQPARRPVPGPQAHADGPRRVALPRASRWCRWPRPCTSASRVEIFRGCTRGCRFCQAGMITRPVRERSITTIGDMVENGIRKSGFEEVGPALAVQRRPHRDRRGRQGPGRPLRGHQRLAVAALAPGSTPSTSRLANEFSRNGRRSGLTFAPEGGSRADAQGDQQDGHRGGPDPHRRHGVLPRLAAGEALLHVRPAHRDRRGRPARSPTSPRR